MPLQSLDDAPGYLKAGFQGFQGTGKTRTAVLLAMVARKHFKLDGPVAMFDTETGSAYIKDIVKNITGKPLVGARSRSIDDLLALGDDCIKEGVSVLVVDSMTHVWRTLCDGYLAKVNQARESKGWKPRFNLEFQDWNPIKQKFGQWTDFYLNSPLHIVICGRAGHTYDHEQNENGKKELVKTGTKMKTEGEFGFEPSLLVEMELEQHDGTTYNVAHVLKDRFDEINLKEFRFGGVADQPLKEQLNAVYAAFGPHLKRLVSGSHTPVSDALPDVGVDETGDTSQRKEMVQREILREEIQGLLVTKWPGQTADEKKSKQEAIHSAFGTRSWTAVEQMHSDRLRQGLAYIKNLIQEGAAA